MTYAYVISSCRVHENSNTSLKSYYAIAKCIWRFHLVQGISIVFTRARHQKLLLIYIYYYKRKYIPVRLSAELILLSNLEFFIGSKMELYSKKLLYWFITSATFIFEQNKGILNIDYISYCIQYRNQPTQVCACQAYAQLFNSQNPIVVKAYADFYVTSCTHIYINIFGMSKICTNANFDLSFFYTYSQCNPIIIDFFRESLWNAFYKGNSLDFSDLYVWTIATWFESIFCFVK